MIYRNNVVSINDWSKRNNISFYQKIKKVKWGKLLDLMIVPSGIAFIIGTIFGLTQFRKPSSAYEELVSVRPSLGYIGFCLMIPIILYFSYMIKTILSEIYSEINLKRWFNNIKDIFNGQ